jgi:hypothetical protein
MTFLVYFIIFLLLVAAVFLICGLDVSIRAQLRRGKKAGSMRFRKHPVLTKLRRLEQKRRLLLSETKTPLTVYWLLTGLGAAGGAVVGKIFFSETFFALAVGLLGALGPMLYLNYRMTQSKGHRASKLQASMMLLSNSYLVTEDFLKSVQDNVDLLEYPEPFRDFLTYVSLIDGNVNTGLRRMANQVDNSYFSQWVDVLALAQNDRRMKYVTTSVVDAMNDVRQAQREADTAMYAIWREYFTVLILIFSTPMIFRVLMKPAYLILVSSLSGQILLALLLAAAVYSLIQAVRLNRPLLM